MESSSMLFALIALFALFALLAFFGVLAFIVHSKSQMNTKTNTTSAIENIAKKPLNVKVTVTSPITSPITTTSHQTKPTITVIKDKDVIPRHEEISDVKTPNATNSSFYDIKIYRSLLSYACDNYNANAIELCKCYCNWVNALHNNADNAPLKQIGDAFINECKKFVEYVCSRDETSKTWLITFLDEHMNPSLCNVCNEGMCALQNYINNF